MKRTSCTKPATWVARLSPGGHCPCHGFLLLWVLPSAWPAGVLSDAGLSQPSTPSSSLERRESAGRSRSSNCARQPQPRWRSSPPPTCGAVCSQLIPQQLSLTIQLGRIQGTQAHLSAEQSLIRKVMPPCIHCLTYTKAKDKSFRGPTFLGFIHHWGRVGIGQT